MQRISFLSIIAASGYLLGPLDTTFVSIWMIADEAV